MHSSYALSSDDFAVERDGAAGSLSDLWPGGYQPGDRLGVVLNQPMDPCGCSNLICGTNTLFYDVLRETKGTGGFFRYADTYLIGVGCEPGDFNQLDVWPMHKFVGVLQPTAEAVLETINDRRITLLVLPESGLRCRGEVVLSTWNALLAQVRCVVTYSPADGSRTRRRRRAARQQDRRELRRAGDLLDARHRRRRAGPPAPPAPRHRPRALRSYEEYRTLPNAAAARALLGVTEVLPPGHQEVSRRSAPTIIMPLEVPHGAARRALGAARRAGVAAPVDDEDTGSYELPATGTLLHTPFDAIQRRMGGQFAEWEGWDWISDFGDPIAEHHAVRETVGVWDESPLQKWLFRGPDALAAADYCFTSDMAGARRSARCATARSATSAARCSATAPSTTPATTTAASSSSRRSRPTATTSAARSPTRARRRDRRAHGRAAAPAAAGPEVARAARVADGRRRRIAALLPLPRGRHDRRRARAASSRARATRASSATRSTRRPRTPSGSGARCSTRASRSGIRPYGLAAVESLRIESGLIFIGYDYFPALHVAVPHEPRSHDQARQAGTSSARTRSSPSTPPGITHRMVTLVIAGEEAPDYNTPVYRHGREVGRLLSPSAGRSPTRRPPDRHGLHRDRADRGRHAARGRAVRRPHGARARRPATRSTTRRRRGRGPDADRPVGHPRGGRPRDLGRARPAAAAAQGGPAAAVRRRVRAVRAQAPRHRRARASRACSASCARTAPSSSCSPRRRPCSTRSRSSRRGASR